MENKTQNAKFKAPHFAKATRGKQNNSAKRKTMNEDNNEELFFRSFLGREFDQKVKQQKDNNDKQAQNDVESGSKISQVYHLIVFD